MPIRRLSGICYAIADGNIDSLKIKRYSWAFLFYFVFCFFQQLFEANAFLLQVCNQTRTRTSNSTRGGGSFILIIISHLFDTVSETQSDRVADACH